MVRSPSRCRSNCIRGLLSRCGFPHLTLPSDSPVTAPIQSRDCADWPMPPGWLIVCLAVSPPSSPKNHFGLAPPSVGRRWSAVNPATIAPSIQSSKVATIRVTLMPPVPLDPQRNFPQLFRSQTAGRPLMPARARPGGVRGKSGLHGNTVPANGRRGRPQGKCHRKQTARASAARRPAGKGETVRQERTAPLATGAAG
jgi:hypothetical protein